MDSCEGSETLVQYFKYLRFRQHFRERFHRRFPKCLMLLCITSNISDFYSFRLMFYGYLHVGVIGILLHICSELCHVME